MKRIILKNTLSNNDLFNTNELNSKVKKVYKEARFYYPSGRRLRYLVWSEKYNRCVWARAESCEIVA